MLPGRISLEKTSGKFGSLEKLNTPTPVLYIDFPQGRLKMLGTVMYPKAKFLPIQYASNQKKKSSLTCRGTVGEMIVFSQYYWVGKKEDNPEEKECPLPKDLQSPLGFQSHESSSKTGDETIKKQDKEETKKKKKIIINKMDRR